MLISKIPNFDYKSSSRTERPDDKDNKSRQDASSFKFNEIVEIIPAKLTSCNLQRNCPSGDASQSSQSVSRERKVYSHD